MSSLASPSRRSHWMVDVVLGTLAYLGGLFFLALGAFRSLFQRRGGPPSLRRGITQHLDRLFGAGLPIVALAHVPLGSFLAMQAYFLATFREASGAVVGLGLTRNLSPLVTGFLITAIMATRSIPELRRRPRIGLDEEPGSAPDRDVLHGRRADDRVEPSPARLAAVRVLAALVAGPILSLWGTTIGFLVGMSAARSILSISPGLFINKYLEMVEPRDLFGMVIKALLFAGVGTLIACHEGLRESRGDGGPNEIAAATSRAIALAMVAILVLNTCAFTFLYFSGSPFGPELATG